MSPSVENGYSTDVLLRVSDLKKHFPIERGFLRRVVGHVQAVDGVTFSIRRGETLGLVGESGSGKTTVGRCVIRAIEPTSGKVEFQNEDGQLVDLIGLEKSSLRHLRRSASMIFQDPYASLDPRWTVKDIVAEPLRLSSMASGKQLDEEVVRLLKTVGLEPKHMLRYPHSFSGGQRQRIGIARALSTRPRLIVADEPVSALDVSIQAQILNLLQDLKVQFGLSYLFIAHDLSVVEFIAERVAVMYVGRIVEMAQTRSLFTQPRHPYTEALLAAVPKPDPDLRGKRVSLSGEIANPAAPPPGCHFHPRCRYAQAICKREVPGWEEIAPDHFVACHFARELTLQGVPRSGDAPARD
ncbi:MAG: ATP-binding cassette domain-containing protein [Anaerolineae bacterium]|nr:ATP-binding cassette domain-containing protein [Anaerolineae bacterium]